jgi:L-alanine-DL-glutamate epimerase-like enolase superfamily enzyme
MRTARNYFAVATGLLIEITADRGPGGYGYADLIPRKGEKAAGADSAIAQVTKIFDAGLRGKDPREIPSLLTWMGMQRWKGARLKAGLEMALLDLRAKALGVPVYELLGGAVRENILVMKMVGLRRPEEMAQEASLFLRQGIKALKLKIGAGWKEDVERVRQVREAVGEKLFIKVDANQAYSLEEALRVADAIERYRVETFEQPLSADDWEGMVELSKNSPIPIEADQTVRSASDALRAIRLGAAHVINTSPQKVGGIFEAKRIADLCEIAAIPCIISNVAGSLLNDAAACQVIAASRAAYLPCEVGEFQRISGDPARGLEIHDGKIRLPTAPGLGVQVEF